MPQRPADCLVDEELIRAEVLFDDRAKQFKICFRFIAKLKQQGGPTKPEIIRFAPNFQILRLCLWVTFELLPNDVPRNQINRIPPGFVGDETFDSG